MKKIKLLKPHRHDGIDFAAGQIFTLPIQEAWLVEWLVTHEVAELVTELVTEPVTEPARSPLGATPTA